MASALLNIVKKEIKEILRDPRLFLGMILVPLIMFPIMGLGIRTMIESSAKQEQITNIAVLNLDSGELAEQMFKNPNLIAVFEQNNISIVYLNDYGITSEKEAIRYLMENESIAALLIIPENFSECIYNQTPATIQVYTVLKSAGFEGFASSARVNVVVGTIRQLLVNYLIINMNPDADPNFVTNPVVSYPVTVYKGKEIEGVPPEAITGLMFSQAFMLPFAVMFLLLIAVQFAAISVASEKEQKTLETLLSLPVSRKTILLGKLTGAFFVAVLGSFGYIFGFNFYMMMVTNAMQEEIPMISPEDVGLIITPLGYILLGVSLFLAILVTLSLALLLAAPAEDVRGAQSVVGILVVPMIISAMILAFLSLKMPENVKVALLFVPFINPAITTIELLSGNYWLPIIGIAGMCIEALLFLYITAWFFGTEKLITIRFSLKRKREVVTE